MSPTTELLIEIGCEEIPARMLPQATRDLGDALIAILDRAGLAHGEAVLSWTPRRLAVRVPGTAISTPTKDEMLLGPPAAAAWDKDGNPGKALLGFAAKQGLDPAAFARVETPKGVYAGARVQRGGETLGAVIAAQLPGAVSKLTFPKMMTWGDGAHAFVRPVHWVVALAGGETIPVEIFGVRAGRLTRGHRTLGPGPHEVADVATWERVLEANGVVVDPAARRSRLAAALAENARALGGHPVDDAELLEESADIVEYPGALCGTFDAAFVRDVPKEVLETCLRHHQKAFLVVDDAGAALPAFAVAVNVPRDPEGHVRRGHEWVVSGRLADALYFWTNDRRQRLAERAPALDGVVFQKELGTYAAKSARVERLAVWLVRHLALPGSEGETIARAALLGRCDLVSGLVGEFPELQGVAGGLLARADGEDEAVVAAIYDLYRPSGAEDLLPATRLGRLLGLADRLDTLAGGFAVGMAPSGSRDPFALRRAGIGVVRLAATEAGIELGTAIDAALAGFDGSAGSPNLATGIAAARPRLIEFLLERFAGLAEKGGARYDEIAAVRSVVSTGGAFVPADMDARLAALREFRTSEDFLALAAASKRVGNILAQAAGRGDDVAPGDGAEALVLPAERALGAAAAGAEESLAQLAADGRYRDALAVLAGLRPVVDTFFDDVLVMDDDDRVRRARLGLLARVRRLSRAVVDIAEIVVEGSERR